jgi:hypothetical protein
LRRKGRGIIFTGGKSSKAEASYLEDKPEMTEDDVWRAEEVTSLLEKDKNSERTKADPLLQSEPNLNPKGGNVKTAMK